MDSETIELERKTSHRGCAQEIRTLKLDYPELTNTQIAKKVGCDPANVTQVLKRFLGDHSEQDLQDYQANQAAVFDALSLRVIAFFTDDKLQNASARDLAVVLGILFDKRQLALGQATSINLMAVVEVIRKADVTGADEPKSNVIDAQR